jgi:REP element-mobilizing transposase RayT
MARSVRLEYPGAIYHVLSRGDRREAIFSDDADRESFLATLAEMCARTGMRVHSYVLMGNHYHLLLETPEGNLVAGMKWLQGTYTQRFNRRHRLSGHVFQGRYKALPVEAAEEEDYFAAVSEYIHLNPVRARLLDVAQTALESYCWSSYPRLIGAHGLPSWLRRAEVFARLQLPDEGAGSRRRYGAWMARRAREVMERTSTAEQDAAWPALQRGWYVGSEGFRDRLMDLAAGVVLGRKRESYERAALQTHDDRAAARLLAVGLERLELTEAEAARLQQSDPRKQGLAWLVKSRTVVGDQWVCDRLQMGDRSNVSRAVAAYRAPRDRERGRISLLLHVCTD